MQTKAEQANNVLETLAVKSSLSIQVLTECRIGDFRKAMSKAGLSSEEQKEMTAARILLKARDNRRSKLAPKHFPTLRDAASTPKLTKKQVFSKVSNLNFCVVFIFLHLTNQTLPICPFCCMIYAFYDLKTAAS